MLINKNLWQEILEEGERLGIPKTKKRGIIREYLQTQILYHLYNLKDSRYLIFTGGTALRFLYGNGRLSEDLDFDLLKKDLPLKKILKAVIKKQKGEEEIELKLKENKNGASAYFKYKKILFYLGISLLEEEKLTIKFDFSYPEDKIEPIQKTFTKFGYFQNVLTYDESSLLSFKIRALLTRKTERGRDLYDIAKLFSKNITPNFSIKFLKEKKIKTKEEALMFIKTWCKENRKILPHLKKQLQPFLVNEEEVNYLDLFID
jgi:predicted nucleotidyltransferase component of viral defense system